MTKLPQVYKDPSVVMNVVLKEDFVQTKAYRVYEGNGSNYIDMRLTDINALNIQATHGTLIFDICLEDRSPGKRYCIATGIFDRSDTDIRFLSIELSATDGNRIDQIFGHWGATTLLYFDTPLELPVNDNGRFRLVVQMGPTHGDTKVFILDNTYPMFTGTPAAAFPNMGTINKLGAGRINKMGEDVLVVSSDITFFNAASYYHHLSESEIYKYINNIIIPVNHIQYLEYGKSNNHEASAVTPTIRTIMKHYEDYEFIREVL